MKSLVIVLIAITFLISCEHEPVYVTTVVPVTILPTPKLPKLTAEQENSIPDDIYLVLVERDETLLQHIRLINRMIEIHNSRAK